MRCALVENSDETVINIIVYDHANDVFYAPTPYPTDGKLYTWDEATTSWKVVE